MSHGQKRMGNGSRMAAGVWSCGAEFLPLGPTVLKDRLARKDMETWATVAWSIWNARNRFCFEEKQAQPRDILQAATTLMQDYQRWNSHLAEPN